MFTTSVVNLEDLQKLRYLIPSYQRPYVWSDMEIKKLITDFYRSFKEDKYSDYYIGTILTRESCGVAELVDGQQRFTTLWLVALVLSSKEIETELVRILKSGDDLRMSFEIRIEVKNYLESLLNNDKKKLDSTQNITRHPYLKNIAKALATITGYIEELHKDSDLKGFGDYIYKNVRFIKNTTPENIDLNKLFSTINSSGVQLEQTDIIKANLLRNLDQKVLYGKIWESCENMSNFFERNIRISFPKTDFSRIDLTRLVDFDEKIFLYDEKSDQIDGDFRGSIVSLLEEQIDYKAPQRVSVDEKRDSEEVYCRSIINFGQLLIHVYRIHLKEEGKSDFKETFHVNKIVEIFKPLCEKEEIERFFKRLWSIRYLFDKYIIKWISDTDTKGETLELVNINRSGDSYYSRTKYEKSSVLMLQSVLYHTGDYLRQYWLTPYLWRLFKECDNASVNDDLLLDKLEYIDNQLSLCVKLSDKEASYKLMGDRLEIDFNFETYFKQAKGTGFKHYWFQKLEYLLWKRWGDKEKTDAYKNYRIVSRNSVEHIYPQKPENGLMLEEEWLHSFGNLVLLSVSQNSEYGNKAVKVKRSMFEEKRGFYDSLKSYSIFNSFNSDEWTSDKIVAHRDKMIEILKEHYDLM